VRQKGNGGSTKQLDLGLSKDMAVPGGTLTGRIDVLNLFNWTNYGGYDGWAGGPGNPQNYLGGDNAHLGVPGSISGPMRTFKIGMSYRF